MNIRSYRDLKVWQIGMQLLARAYDICARLPGEERYDLGSQIRRAAVSIPSNIAEGRARGGTREFLRFVCIASGSLAELETLALIAHRRQYITQEHCDDFLMQTTPLNRQLNALRTSLMRRLRDTP